MWLSDATCCVRSVISSEGKAHGVNVIRLVLAVAYSNTSITQGTPTR
jgi:hypothetical protein